MKQGGIYPGYQRLCTKRGVIVSHDRGRCLYAARRVDTPNRDGFAINLAPKVYQFQPLLMIAACHVIRILEIFFLS